MFCLGKWRLKNKMTLDLSSYYDFYLHNNLREFVACTAPTCLILSYLCYDLKKEQWRKMTGRGRHISLKDIFGKIGLGDIFEDDENDN